MTQAHGPHRAARRRGHVDGSVSTFQRHLVRHVLFPMQERLKHHTTLKVLRSLEKSQWWSPEQLAASQANALSDLLSEIGAHVPFYRERLAGLAIAPSHLRPSDLSQLPLLDKDTIRTHAQALFSDRRLPMQASNTGGSTGEPLRFFLTRERVSHDVAAKLRSFEWWNVTFGDREMVVWGAPHELGRQDHLRRLRDHLFRSRLLPAFDMGEASLARYCTALRRYRPRVVFGYPSAIALIAEYASAHDIALDDLGVAVVFVTAEQLYPHQRNAIANAFGCPVANGYGARDAGFIAHECPEGRLHITAEDILVEIVDANGQSCPPGEPGEIVTTHLRNRGYPLVRYRTGDLGRIHPEPCPCGRCLPVLAAVEGRSTDFVLTKDGRRVHALALIYILRELSGIREFQVVQMSRDRIGIRLDPLPASEDASASMDATLRTKFREVLGDVSVEIHRQTPIPRPASGKFRYVISEVTTGHA